MALRYPLETTALIVIDMQRDFCAPGGYAAQAGLDTARLAQPIAHIQALLKAARGARLLVIHTREGHRADLSDCPPEKLQRSIRAGAAIGSEGPMGRLLIRGEHGHDFIDELRPATGEVVIDKPGYGAFHQTDLAQVLANRGITHLIVCGVTTEVCVHSTLREAVDRGLACTTVGDACAASNPALQAPALAMIGVEGGLFGQVLDTQAVIAALTPHPVPERYRGVWSRTLLETPAHRDDTSLVLWMQTELWHADLRIPQAARADRVKAPLSSLSAGQQQALALQSGFCGITQVERRSPQEDEICTWHRHVDYQPPGLSPDAGWMVFEADDRVIETGVHGVYREVWERLPDSIGPCTYREHADAQDPARITRILTAGRHVMRVRPRACAWPANTSPGDALSEVLARHPTQASSLLDFEVSFGVLDGAEGLRWTLHHSTLPELEPAA